MDRVVVPGCLGVTDEILTAHRAVHDLAEIHPGGDVLERDVLGFGHWSASFEVSISV